ncbi:5'-3' exonuclease ['Gossypium sp.' phytoplasma]|uniref:5'-3' exonuclease n=1 Tax=Candidatus Phytoplasma gossypii TaxID=2982629 RepID=A0ABT9D1N9_9MOLU|nr:5'-3' exonuclease ['Gossypium sp.' phytoplasma]
MENNNNLNNFDALMIFINMFEKILEKTQNHILVAFDTQGKTKKKEIYLDYKKGRPLIPQLLIDQIVLVQEYLKISGVKYHYQTGYEADDIIGTIAQQASSQQIITDIYSSDHDFLQLINDYVTIRLIRKGLTNVSDFDTKLLQKEYQLKPEQIVDFKSMIGDNSDNIIGIPGIGPKTALKLLHKFNTLDNLLINLKQIPDNLRNKIEPFKDRINLNRLLITIDKTVPLSFDYTQTYKENINLNLLLNFCKKYNLNRLYNKKIKTNYNF